MTSVEAENQPVEDPETFVAMEENGAPRDPQVAVSVLDEAAEEGALSGGEREPAAAGDDLSNPHVFKMAAREVNEGYMSVIRGLSAFGREDEEVCRNAVDICKDIIAMEQSLFSEVPSYVTNYASMQRAKTVVWNKAVRPHWTIPTPEGPPRTWEEQRAYVDPGVPLMLPYNAERFKKEHPERALAEGTYHNLFYGDGTQVVFPASADNKRKQIEEEHRKHPHPSYHGPYVFKPQQKKPMRVASDFVPSCAEPDRPRVALRKKPVNKTKAEKSQKKVTTK
ncbi:hypothetical protein, conserved [Leishmania donovani]|uniref:Uncharacterized protein n=1 Tax=Leishmania donovani TaxID=5661 RepID=E9BHH7_LEIDO|nr:hypothetical protein, conserved [Leishmania donovani]TPP40691.1 hypothetical protein CGC21_8445 [Leishmania donovani]CBZ34703.1 hypothetical protein, conserved [Leishmania donovani]